MGRNGLPIQISLPDGFLSAETRCGYDISSRVKRIWAVELDLLSQIQRVCAKHNIQYVALWGTALGAVRHHGFIPWDDDIDVGMDRENYNKFCKIALSEFEYPYFFQNPYTDKKYFAPLARLRNSKTTALIKEFDSPDYNNGIYIDIDILDGLASSRMKWQLQNFMKHIALIPIKMRAPFYPFWIDIYKRVRCMYNGKANRMGISYSFLESDWNSWLSPEEFASAYDNKFEFMDIKIPSNCECYLKRVFGEWQNFPAKEERGRWHAEQIYFDPDLPYSELLRRYHEVTK